MTRSAGLAAGVLAAAAVVWGLLALQDRPPSLPRKQLLARLPSRVVEGGAAVSGDLRHVAFQEQLDRGVRMILDGVPGPAYGFISTRSFAPGSDRLFYWARQPAAGRSDQMFLVAGGTPYPVGVSRHEYLTFSQDGRRWAVLAGIPAPPDGAPPDDRGVFVLVDGREQGRWIDASAPAFAGDGAHVAWLVAEPAPAGGSTRRLLVDGSAVATYAGSAGPCVSPIEPDVEGTHLPRYERVFYLADGRLVALVRDGDGWTLRRDHEVLGRYPVVQGVSTGGQVMEVAGDACARQPAIASGSLAAAKDTPALFWWERLRGRWRVVRDGLPVDDVTCERPWELQPPVVSDDGNGWAYPCVTGTPVTGQEILVVTPRGRYGPYREVWSLALSDDGSRVAYGASVEGGVDATWRIYADGVPFPPGYHAVWRPRFDPTGHHVAWEGIPSPGARPWLAIDGRNLVRFDELINGPVFLEPGWASWAVRQGRRLARINLGLDASVPLRSATGGG